MALPVPPGLPVPCCCHCCCKLGVTDQSISARVPDMVGYREGWGRASLRAPLPFLPGSLWLPGPLWPGGHSHLHHLCCCYLDLCWGHCYSQERELETTATLLFFCWGYGEGPESWTPSCSLALYSHILIHGSQGTRIMGTIPVNSPNSASPMHSNSFIFRSRCVSLSGVLVC